MHWIEWFIGPQLIGAIFLLAGFIQKKYPPKKINNLYGYRTPASMKSQERWDEANRFAAIYFIKLGGILLIVGFLLTLLIYCLHLSPMFRSVSLFLAIMASSMGSVIALLTTTERHLERTFDDKE